MDWQTFWTNLWNGIQPYLAGIIIFVIALILALFLYFLLPKLLLRFTPQKFYEENRVLIQRIVKTVLILVIIGGLYLGISVMPFFGESGALVAYKQYWNVILSAILLLLIANLLIRIIKYILQRKAELQKRMEKTPNILSKLFTFLIYAIVILSIFSINKIDITPIMATLGIAGVAIGFAVKTPLENIISGLYLLIVRPISLGDYIDLGGSEGYVDNIQMTSTKIRTLGGSIILIPNTMIISSKIINHTAISSEKAVTLNIKVAQNSDLEHVLKVTKDVAVHIQATLPECVPDFTPSVVFTDLEANALNVLVVLKAQKIEGVGKVKHELLLVLLTTYHTEKIDIPPPMRRYEAGSPIEEGEIIRVKKMEKKSGAKE